MGQSSSHIPEAELEKLRIESGLSKKGIITLYNRFNSLATHRDRTTQEYFLTKSDFQHISAKSDEYKCSRVGYLPFSSRIKERGEKEIKAITELRQNPLGDRIIDAFFADAEVLERRKVYFKDFVRVLSHFRPINKNKPHTWNSREAKLRFAFTMYDLNKSGTITKDEFREILQMLIGENVSQEQVSSIAERTMHEADKDRDGFITFQEFCTAMEKTDIEQKMSFRFLN